MRRLGAAGAAILLIAACGDDGTPMTTGDAATEADAGDSGPATPTPPVAPAAVDFACAAGWRRVATDAEQLAVCEPYPESGRADCPVGSMHLPGATGCTPVGAACPADGWPSGLPTDVPVVFALATATGGDGTRAAPFGTLAAAIATLTGGGVVAAAEGTFPEDVSLLADVTLVGACTTGTRLEPPGVDMRFATVRTTRRDGGLSDLTVAGLRPGVLASGGSASMHLEGVLLTGWGGPGIATASGARITGSSISVRDADALPPTAVGLFADGGEIAVERVSVRGARTNGAFVTAGGRLALADSVVSGTLPNGAGEFGAGVWASDGATATAQRVALVDNGFGAAVAFRASSRVELTDVVVRDTGLPTGVGLIAQSGAVVQADRVLVDRSLDAGVVLLRSEATVQDLVVRDGLGAPATRERGNGLIIQDASSLTATRLGVLGNADSGVFVLDGATASLDDLHVHDTRSAESDGTFGRGLYVQDGASGTVRRAYLEANRDAAVFLSGAGARLDAEDVTIVDTRVRDGDGTWGRGIHVQAGSSLSGTRVVIRDGHDAGIGASGPGTIVDLTDLVVMDTDSQDDGRFGRGLNVGIEALVSIDRALFDGNRDVTVAAFDAGTDISLSDVVIGNTTAPRCIGTTCPDRPDGHGVGAYTGAHVGMERFLVHDSDLCGIQVSRGGTADARDGEVRANRCGVNVQTEGFDVSRVTTNVRYRDNDVNLDTASLPVPEPGSTL